MKKWTTEKHPNAPDETTVMCEDKILGTFLKAADAELAVNAVNKELPKGVFTFLDVSMMHVTPDDYKRLANTNFPLVVYFYPEGCFVHSGRIYLDEEEWRAQLEERIGDLRRGGMSEAFIAVWRTAVELDCWFLRLDADGTEFEEFEVQDWSMGVAK